jgi:hypothetical protein
MSFSSDQPLLSNQLSDFDIPENFDDFSDVFEREHKRVIDTVNTKEGGLYLLQESATFQQYFNEVDPQSNRNVYRKVINFGSLPNATTKRVPHNVALTSTARITRMYGGSTDPSTIQFKPLPFSSPTLINNVTLEADQTDIIITTGADLSAFRFTTVVFEYTKG